MNLTRLVVDQDIPDSRETILRLLIDYNLRNSPPPNFQLLGILLKDDQGQTIGGLWGRSAYEWLFVELLFIPEELRGQGLGTTLIRQAEEIARERNCTGVWLDTFDFQALPFYQKLGYTVFGELKDHPRGISQHWLQRRFDT
ncbi:MAG TPA: GNAT family N-acetyltransferase [Acidobacteriaceae bacterium]|jgi:GNAT superfamily N-acetyltransferase|nr:GNAT family N-acetyltransferase [Acidobacteriaceae bacterium]